MKRVLLDCDGVLADFVGPILGWHGEGKKHEHVTCWDILEALDCEHRQEELDAFCSEPGFCESLPVHEGAQDFVERLRSRFEVVVVTAPYGNVPTWCYERLRWLEKHFEISKHDVVFTKRKCLVSGDFLVDDKIENFEGFRGRPLLLDQPWNRSRGAQGVLVCGSLQAVVVAIEHFDEKETR